MKTARKAMMAVLCVLMVIVATVTGTLAYLTDNDAVTNTFTVGNVQITLDEKDVDKDEDKTDNVTVNGVVRDKANEYHLLPGVPHTKDPTVAVLEGSEESYIRMVVKVKNIDKLEAALPQYTKDAEGKDVAIQYKDEAGNIVNYYVDLNNDNNADFVLEKLLNNTWNFNQWHFNKYKEESETVGEGENKVTTVYGVYEFRYYKTVTGPADNADGVVDEIRLEPLFTTIKIPGAHIDNTHLAYLKDVVVNVEAHAIQKAGFETDDAAWTAFDTQHA